MRKTSVLTQRMVPLGLDNEGNNEVIESSNL